MLLLSKNIRLYFYPYLFVLIRSSTTFQRRQALGSDGWCPNYSTAGCPHKRPSCRFITNNEHETRRGVRQGASYISAAKPQKCYCMGSMNVVLANVALASAGSLEHVAVVRRCWRQSSQSFIDNCVVFLVDIGTPWSIFWTISLSVNGFANLQARPWELPGRCAGDGSRSPAWFSDGGLFSPSPSSSSLRHAWPAGSRLHSIKQWHKVFFIILCLGYCGEIGYSSSSISAYDGLRPIESSYCWDAAKMISSVKWLQNNGRGRRLQSRSNVTNDARVWFALQREVMPIGRIREHRASAGLKRYFGPGTTGSKLLRPALRLELVGSRIHLQ